MSEKEKQSLATETVEIDGTAYTLFTEDGKKKLKRYDEKSKMWVILEFSEESAPNSVIETLSNLYIERILQSTNA